MSSDLYRVPVPENLLFKGRPGDLRLGEWVSRGELSPNRKKDFENVVVWGCPDDTGVVRNRGRAGAKDGPDSIRKHLYRMTPPMDLDWEERLRLVDYGNLVPGTHIGETQTRCRSMVSRIARADATVIALGGGHDFAAPNFLGFVDGRRGIDAIEKFGLLNVDPHLDVRELEEGLPHSGTPFRQILESTEIDSRYFVQFGTRANRNTRAHFEYCRERRVTILPLERLREGKSLIKTFQAELKKLCRQRDTVAVTFDMDACADTEGISAAPVLGFSAWELCQMAQVAGEERRVRFLEIAEVSPALDFNERSSRIAAEMIFFFLRARAIALKPKKR